MLLVNCPSRPCTSCHSSAAACAPSQLAPCLRPDRHRASSCLFSSQSSALRTGRLLIVRSAPTYNPQNVPDPQVMPSPEFSPEEAVRAQLDALRNSNSPWPNHGIQTMYEFGLDIGGMERSRYFGMSKDLYHFDHFLGQFQNSFPEVFDMKDYSIAKVEEAGNEHHVTASIRTSQSSAPVSLLFKLARKDVGKKKGSLMTKTLLKQTG